MLSAKIETVDNNIPKSAPFRASGFPTIKLKKTGTREFIDYNGVRSVENLIAFVHENAKNLREAPAGGNSPCLGAFDRG